MVIAYDQEARSRQLFIDEAKEREEAEKKKVAENMALLSAELESAKKSSVDTFKHLQKVTLEKEKVTFEKVQSEKRLAELEKELSALRSSRESDLEAAVAEARRTAVGEVQSQLKRAYDMFSDMMKAPMTRLIHYSQAMSNLQILDDMINPEEAFDPVAERAHIEGLKVELGRADDVFDEMAVELKELLGKNYELSIKLVDQVFSPRLETVAKSVGIHTASGSNDGSLGLRLREASEEPNEESEEGEADKADELVGPQNDPAPSA